MGKIFLEYVEAPDVQVCAGCRAHLASHETIISKAFQGRHGRAYLFSDVVNVNSGPTENRLLLTGLHVVADIYCNGCETRLGWKYVEAYEESQKYKEGKFILEKAMIVKEDDEVKRRDDEGATPAAGGGDDEPADEAEDDDEDDDEEEPPPPRPAMPARPR